MGYVNVDIYVDDIISDIDTDEMVVELQSRGYEVTEKNSTPSCFMLRKDYFSKDELYRHLCDIAEVGYYTDKNTLIENIKDLL